MTERNDPSDPKSGIRLTEEVIQALPPLSREDEAVAAIVERMMRVAKLLQQGDIEIQEP
jgi:predicted ATPase